MMMTQKTLTRLVLLGLALLTFGSSTAYLPTSQAQTRLTLWVMPSGLDLPRRINVEVNAFAQQNPGVIVDVITIPWTQAYEEIQRAVRGEVPPPDVLQIGTTWVDSIGAQGVLHFYNKDEIDAVGGPSVFVAPTWQASQTTIDGEVLTVGLPWFNETRALIYRTDLMALLELDPDTVFSSWETFSAAMEQISAAGLVAPAREGPPLDVYPIMIAGRPGTNAVHDFAVWVWNAGGDFIDETGTRATLSSEAALAGIRYYTDFYTRGFTYPNAASLTSSEADFFFLNRRSVMLISGPWALQRIRTTGLADEIAVTQLPEGPAGNQTFVGGSSVAVWQASPNLKDAVALAQFLSSEESQARFTTSAGLLPARTVLLEPFREDPLYRVFVEATENSRTYPALTRWAPVEEALSDGFAELWTALAGVTDPAQADAILRQNIQAMEATVNALLAQPAP